MVPLQEIPYLSSPFEADLMLIVRGCLGGRKPHLHAENACSGPSIRIIMQVSG
jgi:hypothetical protein